MFTKQRYQFRWVGTPIDLILSSAAMITVILIPVAIVTMVQNFELVAADD